MRCARDVDLKISLMDFVLFRTVCWFSIERVQTNYSEHIYVYTQSHPHPQTMTIHYTVNVRSERETVIFIIGICSLCINVRVCVCIVDSIPYTDSDGS